LEGQSFYWKVGSGLLSGLLMSNLRKKVGDQNNIKMRSFLANFNIKKICREADKCPHCFKGNVSRDGRWYKSGINRTVSSNLIAYEAKKNFCVKGKIASYI